MSTSVGEPRSYLYVPGDREQMLAKALARGADAIIVDLEDAVAPARKLESRATVAAWLADVSATAVQRTELWVRINAGAAGVDDLAAVFSPILTGVCVPKVSSRSELELLERELVALERDAGIAPVSTPLLPLVETAAGVLAAYEIATSHRVRRLQLGELDLSSELGTQPGVEEQELLPVRSQLVLVCAAAGLVPPVGPVTGDIGDLERFTRSCRALRRLGYRSRACIHPAQVAIANDVFGVGADELARARELVDEFDRTVAAGSGVLVGRNGEMIDEAVVRAARLAIARAEGVSSAERLAAQHNVRGQGQ